MQMQRRARFPERAALVEPMLSHRPLAPLWGCEPYRVWLPCTTREALWRFHSVTPFLRLNRRGCASLTGRELLLSTRLLLRMPGPLNQYFLSYGSQR